MSGLSPRTDAKIPSELQSLWLRAHWYYINASGFSAKKDLTVISHKKRVFRCLHDLPCH